MSMQKNSQKLNQFNLNVNEEDQDKIKIKNQIHEYLVKNFY